MDAPAGRHVERSWPTGPLAAIASRLQAGRVLAMPTTLVRNGTVVTASDRYDADILVEDGVIRAIGRGLPQRADTVVDAAGRLVMPGGIDAHTHLDLELDSGVVSADDFLTGTIAAAHGGTTTIVDFPTQARGQGLYEAFDRWRAKAEGKAVVDYGFHMIVRDVDAAVCREMQQLATADGVTSFKLFMAYRGALMLDDAALLRVMQQARECGALVCMHAENGDVIDELVRQALARGETAPKYHALTRPPACEGEATGRALTLAAIAGVPLYVVHVTCADAVEKIAAARGRGQEAFGETCPQYLFLSFQDYERPGFEGAKFVMSPPLRDAWHQDRLWHALRANDLQAVSTDHCPFGMDAPPRKRLGEGDFSKIPNGGPGIEDRLMLLWDGGVRTGRLSEHRFVELVSTNPARIFGLWPRKGTIAVGSDADMVIWDTGRRVMLSARTHHMRVDYNLYEGRVVTGAPAMVISRGEVIVEEGQFVGRPGRGQYLKRAPFHAAR